MTTCERVAAFAIPVERQRAVVAEHEPGDVPGHERGDLDVPDRRRGDDGVVDPASPRPRRGRCRRRAGPRRGARRPARCRRAARSSAPRRRRRRSAPACAQARGRARRASSAAAGRAGSCPRSRPSRSPRRRATMTARPTPNASSSAVPLPAPRLPKKSWRSGATSLNSGPELAPSKAVMPIADEQQRRGARHRVEADRADARRAGVEHAVAADQRREPGEEREVGAERVGVARPRLDAVEAHPDERHHEVAEPQDRERLRLAAARPAELADPKKRIPAAAGQRPRRSG